LGVGEERKRAQQSPEPRNHAAWVHGLDCLGGGENKSTKARRKKKRKELKECSGRPDYRLLRGGKPNNAPKSVR